MKNIEQIVRENRSLFDTGEPADGHLERFEWKLKKRLHSGVKRSILPYMLRAAVVTLLVTLSSLWIWDHFLRPGKDRMALGDVSPQYREVENYYVHQVNVMEEQLVNADFISPEQRQMLNNELKSMDSVYIQLQKDLKANPDDERIINAMIEHYQTKVEVMSYILGQLKTIRDENLKNGDYEKAVI